MMDDIGLARALHVLAVVVWIGGVAMVTSVILPAARRMAKPVERIAFFEIVERRLAAMGRADEGNPSSRRRSDEHRRLPPRRYEAPG
jgi:uncharacterized membrane protein